MEKLDRESNLKEKKTPTPKELKEERLRQLLREFEEILNMDDEEWAEYEEE